jgi:hypothetical protein
MMPKLTTAFALIAAGLLAATAVQEAPVTTPPVATGSQTLSGFGGSAGAHEFFTQVPPSDWKGDIGGIGPSTASTPWRFEVLGIDATGVTGPADRYIYFNIQDSETGSSFKHMGINFHPDSPGAAGGTLFQAYQPFTSEGISSHGLNSGDLTASNFDLRFDFYKALAGGRWVPFVDGPFTGSAPFDFLGAKLVVGFDGGADGVVNIDNMRLVPEPASLNLLVLGGLMIWRRCRTA